MFEVIKCTSSYITALLLYNMGIATAAATTIPPQELQLHPLYAGIATGVGSTTWQGLVPSKENQNLAINLSTPTQAQEGGAVWSAFAGYEFSPYFALEANYMHYPQATITFDESSFFAFENADKTSLTTSTEALSAMAKIMLIIPHTNIRAYSSAGAAEVHRADFLYDNWQITPTFGLGFNFNITTHLMGELAGNYTAGRGESELNPVADFLPFLYSLSVRLAYRI